MKQVFKNVTHSCKIIKEISLGKLSLFCNFEYSQNYLLLIMMMVVVSVLR